MSSASRIARVPGAAVAGRSECVVAFATTWTPFLILPLTIGSLPLPTPEKP